MSLLKKILAEAGEVDEVGELAALFRISQLPTLVVEDSSDVRIYSRWLEQHLLGTYKVDVLSAGGRENLLNLYERRNEFIHAPVIFIVNRGMWLFTEKPKYYDDLICTQGYSIENDVYSRGGVEYLLDSARSKGSWIMQESVIRWFAIEVEAFKNGILPEFEIDLDKLVPKDQTEPKITCLRHSRFRYPKDYTIEELRRDYRLKLPGKLLFEMLARFSDTSLQGLYNTALVNYELTEGPQSLVSQIIKKLDKQESASDDKILSEPKTTHQVPVVQWTRPTVRNSNEKINTNKLYSDADELILDLIDYKPTVITDSNFGWWIEQLEKHLKPRKVKELDEVPDILSIEGKSGVLSLYDRRDEFTDLPVAFVGNREMWSFEGIPAEYENIIWTQGYSLENDLYADAGLERLLYPHETWKHRQVLNSTIEWFAFKVEEFLSGKDPELEIELAELVPQGQFELNEKFCKQQPKVKRIQQIREDYNRLLPGKFLFQILTRFLNVRGRDFNFNTTPEGLHDIAFTMPSSKPLLGQLIRRVEQKLDGEARRIEAEDSTTSQQRKINNQVVHHVELKQPLKKQFKPKTKQNQMSKLIRTQSSKSLKPMVKQKIKVGDKINAKILKNDSTKVTVQLMTDNREEITFDHSHFPGQVGKETELRVISFDSTGKVNKVAIKLRDTQPPPTPIPSMEPKVKTGDKIMAKILEKDGIKVTVQLMTDNHEEISFEAPYYPGKVGEEPKLRVIAVDNTGKVTKVVP